MEKKGRFDFDFSGRKVLVVEDTLMSFKLIKAVLTQVKADVDHAVDGSKAIEMCSGDNSYDLVVMDIQMPGIDGLEATRAIKEIHPDLPVIAATANTFEDEEAASREAGCDDFITKPLKFVTLFEKMQRLFDRQV